MLELREKIGRARFKFNIEEPFLATILMDHEVRITEDQEIANTAAMDIKKKTIYLYKPFIEVLNEEELIWTFAHEASHYLYYAKMRDFNVDPRLWNIAQDFIINIILNDMRIGEMPEVKARIDEKGKIIYSKTIGEPAQFMFDERFRGWTTEEVYQWLLKHGHTTTPVPGVTKITMPLPISCPVCNGKGSIREKGSSKTCPNCGGTGHIPSADETTFTIEDKVYGTPRNPDDVEGIREKVAKDWSISGSPGWERFIDEILSPALPWQAILQRFLFYKAKIDYSFLPPGKKTWVTGMYFPVLSGIHINAVIAVDSSGSISEEEFTYFMSEVFAILNAFPSKDIWIFVCDSEIRREQHIFGFGTVNPEIFVGWGGTNYNPVFKRVEELRIRPDILIYFSDLVCGIECFPERAPFYPVIWVCTSEEPRIKPPFGEVIFYKRPKVI